MEIQDRKYRHHKWQMPVENPLRPGSAVQAKCLFQWTDGILWEDSATRNLHGEYPPARVLMVNPHKLSP